MAETVYMLTTVDNPYNPFDDFNKWYLWDEQNGYHSCERMARLVKDYPSMTEEERQIANEKAIDKVIFNDFTGLFRKVDRKTAKELVDQRLSDSFSLETI